MVNCELHEHFLGSYKVNVIQSNTIVVTLLNILKHLNLTLVNRCGQCYDGASNIAGSKGSVSTQLGKEEPHAVYTH